MARKCSLRGNRSFGSLRRWSATREPRREPIKEKVNHRCGVEGQYLAQKQTTHNRNTKWPAQFRTDAAAQCQGQSAEERGERRHHDRTEAQQARLVNCFMRRLALLPFGVEREVDHHDRV